METELKLDLTASGATAIAKSTLMRDVEEGRKRHFVTTYFDTTDEALRRAGVVLRLRDDGQRRVQTVKISNDAAVGLFTRIEEEFEIEGLEPVINADCGRLTDLIGNAVLEPRFVTEITRLEGILRWQGACIELALDTGHVRAGDTTQALTELELELRDGPVAALFDLARKIDVIAPLRLGILSKSERGQLLRDGVVASAFKADPVCVNPSGTTTQAFVLIATSCLRHFRLNEAILLEGGGDASTLHQTRVGIRRLRSALSLFKPLLRDDPRFRIFATELKMLSRRIGEVRDLDVLIGRQQGGAQRILVAHRSAAFETLIANLRSSEVRQMMLSFAEWLVSTEWCVHSDDENHVTRDAKAFGSRMLDKRFRLLKRHGKHLMRLSDVDRHLVRIEAKELRYGAEFFAAVWNSNKARNRQQKFLRRIASLQEELGNLNDNANSAAITNRLNLHLETSMINRGSALASLEIAFDRLIRIRPFWR